VVARTGVIAAVGLLAAVAPRGLSAQRRPARAAQEWLERCREQRDDERARACEVREVGFHPHGSAIHLDASPNGGVAISAWDRDSVHVEARIQATGRTADAAAALLRDVQVEVSGASVRASGPDSHGRRGWAVSYVVQLPRRSDVRAATVNGPVSAEGVSGRIELETTNGPLTLRDLAGDVRARATNGPLTVALAGARWEGAGLDAETRNGPATVSIPEGYSAVLETGTVNGPMRVDVPLTVQGRIGRMTRITTTLGSGGAPVRVMTTNGPLSIRRP
jgi:hypothetical protein